MSEEPTSPAEAGDTGPVAGERLAEARRVRDISVNEIARELHLDDTKVRALEQNDFERLGPPVFIKGYLRKYASLVGLSGDDILADYERLKPADTPPIIGLRTHPKPAGSPGLLIAIVAVVLVAALGAWWWFAAGPAVPDRAATPAGPSVEPAEPETPGGDPALEVVEESEPLGAPAGQLEAGEAPPSPRAPAADTETADVAAARQEEQAVPDPVPAAGQVALQLTFSGDCWTEVTDAGGNRLYFGLGSEGRTVAVEGEPPLQVLLGDSENVSVTVDGAPYTVPRSARRGDTARFTITP
jgi:cytoskeleton protein RodZ